MCKVLVFAGTTEGRKIAEFLAEQKVLCHICVATDYGEELLPKGEHVTVSHDRLDAEQMESLMRRIGAAPVIDATHPYAAEVTKNIRMACEKAGCRYVRLLRESQDVLEKSAVYVDSVEEAAEYLKHTEGNVLVTTGSKEIGKYTVIPGYEKRIFARVLSLPSVAAQCAEWGFEGRNLICMQGPFSAEMNQAMIEQFQCRYLVTKLSGTTGGFPEKMEAAARTGCIPVIIGRPLSEQGFSLMECRSMLCEQFSLHPAQRISLVGIGMGNEGSRTAQAQEILAKAQLVIGARRMVKAAASPGQDVYIEYDSKKISDYIKNHPEYQEIAIALSGDVGFYSGARKLQDELGGNVQMVCGISSVVYFMAKIGKSWDDAYITSAHGRESNLIGAIRTHEKVFAILGQRGKVAELSGKLLQYGMGNVKLYVGENLSYEHEKILSGKPEDFLEYEGDALSVVYLENDKFSPGAVTHGIPDGLFQRDKVPMTKEEVRTVSLSKLRLTEEAVCYDVGAGTGSVSVEMALCCRKGRVYAVEKKEEAVSLLEKNRIKFALDNLTVVKGMAPDILEELEPPTHAFIGGSSGNMQAVMRLLLKKNPGVRIVINCIALESAAEALKCIKELPVTDTEIVQLSVGRAREVGPYHMMMGENPITIISCTGKPRDEE